jgi:hypothetical protein
MHVQRTTLQVNFKLRMPVDQYLALCAAAAPAIAEVPGLQWKLFTLAKNDDAAGGVYLFADRASAESYAAGPILGGLRDHPGIRDLSIRLMDVNEELSHVTSLARSRSE